MRSRRSPCIVAPVVRGPVEEIAIGVSIINKRESHQYCIFLTHKNKEVFYNIFMLNSSAPCSLSVREGEVIKSASANTRFGMQTRFLSAELKPLRRKDAEDIRALGSLAPLRIGGHAAGSRYQDVPRSAGCKARRHSFPAHACASHRRTRRASQSTCPARPDRATSDADSRFRT
jgi:hypothetical protein